MDGRGNNDLCERRPVRQQDAHVLALLCRAVAPPEASEARQIHQVGFVGHDAYQRKVSRPFNNVDGRVHEAAGPELQLALNELASATAVDMPLTFVHPWRGAVLPQSTSGRVACLTGCAVRTPAFGELRSRTNTVIYAVTPDGHYKRSRRVEDTKQLALLQQTFSAAIAEAARAGATSLAVPALGCGVHNWPHRVAARAAFAAAASWLRERTEGTSPLGRVDFVLRDDTWHEWLACARERFGNPMREEGLEAVGNALAWDFSGTAEDASS